MRTSAADVGPSLNTASVTGENPRKRITKTGTANAR